MSACAHKHSISQVVCAILLVLIFSFGAVPEVQAGAITNATLQVDFVVGDGLSMGTPFTPERTDLENLQVEGGTVYISGLHDGLGSSLVPANRDANLNQRAQELSASLAQELPLNSILIDFQGYFDDATISTKLSGRELLAYQANEGMAYTPGHLVQVTPNVYSLNQFFSHIDRNLENLEKLTLYYSVDFGFEEATDPSESEESSEFVEDVTEPTETSEPLEETTESVEESTEPTDEVTEPSEDLTTETSTEETEETTIEETTENTEDTEATESEEVTTEESLTVESVTDETATEETASEASETEETTPEVSETEEPTGSTENEEVQGEPVEEVDSGIITVILKTPEELALEQVKNEISSLIKPVAETEVEVITSPTEATVTETATEAPEATETNPVTETPSEDNTQSAAREGVVLLANLPSDPAEPTTDPTTEPRTTPADPAMETAPSEAEPQVQLQAPGVAPTSKLDQRFSVLSEASATLEGYLPTLPEQNAFAARVQQRRIEELITELRGQASTNEHKQILQHAEDVLSQSALKLEIKSTVVLIGATGESLLYTLGIGSTLLALGVGLIFLRKRRRSN